MIGKHSDKSDKSLNIGNDHDTPLPIIVARKWGFPLQYHVIEGKYWFSVQDWLRGLTETDDVRMLWAKTKDKLLNSIQQLPYLSTDDKTYQMDFSEDIGLYLIAQSLRATESRPLLAAIKDYLAQAGAFTDLVRREPETVLSSGVIEPDEAIEAAIEEYRRRGKDDNWINARVMGKVKRKMFTDALNAAIAEMQEVYYAIATDEVYQGLWQRTAKMLRLDMGIPLKKSLRDNQPTLALTYQAIAEEVSAEKLGDRNELEWEEARQIVHDVAELIGIQAKATGEYLGLDLATGKPLLGE